MINKGFIRRGKLAGIKLSTGIKSTFPPNLPRLMCVDKEGGNFPSQWKAS